MTYMESQTGVGLSPSAAKMLFTDVPHEVMTTNWLVTSPPEARDFHLASHVLYSMLPSEVIGYIVGSNDCTAWQWTIQVVP